jgi:hypothetical protein
MRDLDDDWHPGKSFDFSDGIGPIPNENEQEGASASFLYCADLLLHMRNGRCIRTQHNADRF